MYGVKKPAAEVDTNHYTYKQWFQGVYEFIFSKTHVVTITTSYTVAADVYYIRADSTAGTVTITLPTASGCTGREIVVKKIDASAFNIIIDGYSSETIDGAANVTFNTQYESYTLVSNGSNWEILASEGISMNVVKSLQ